MSVVLQYRSFGDSFDVVVPTPSCFVPDEDALLRDLFESTNTYSGTLWNLIEPLLPADRNHTALSVGDSVLIGEVIYQCERFGWSTHFTL